MTAPVLMIAAVSLSSLAMTRAGGPPIAERSRRQRILWRVQLAAVAVVLAAVAILAFVEPS